jgi:hypothetical protein
MVMIVSLPEAADDASPAGRFWFVGMDFGSIASFVSRRPPARPAPPARISSGGASPPAGG